jgi:UDP-glucose 4-epimerase
MAKTRLNGAGADGIMKKVLITGGAGFLGSCLAEALLKKGDWVIVADDLSHGSLRNISDLLPSPCFAFHQGNILDRGFLEAISRGVDLVVHFAAYKIPREGDALRTIEVNVKGTEIVLEMARERKIPVLFGSTDDVYGVNPELPFSEESALVIGNSKSVRWSDAISKAYSEQLCFAYQDAYQVPVNILRFAIVYGPKQRKDWWGGPQGVFIDKALKKEPIPIHGDGLQIRNFVYVTDAVEGILGVIEREEARGEVLNIGSSDPLRVLDLAYKIWSLAGNTEKPKIEFISYSDLCRDYEDVRAKTLDLTKARWLIGYEPKVGIEEGLEKTIDWFRAQK